MSAAVRLVRFFSAAFATIFMSWGSVTVPSSAKRLAERDSSQQHAAQQRDAGSTTLNCLVDLDRLEPHPVQAQLVQDQAAASGGCGAAAGWLAALSEPPERLLDTVRQADTNPRDRALHRGSITAWTGREGCAQLDTPRTAAPHPRSAPAASAEKPQKATRRIL